VVFDLAYSCCLGWVVLEKREMKSERLGFNAKSIF
jgi:hypothetical protein